MDAKPNLKKLCVTLAIGVAGFFAGRVSVLKETRTLLQVSDELQGLYSYEQMPREDVALALSLSLKGISESPTNVNNYTAALQWIYALERVNSSSLKRFNRSVPDFVQRNEKYLENYQLYMEAVERNNDSSSQTVH